jgi:uncharacterized membrane protein YgdD (TMEM256/DUF423 family)
VFVFIRAYPRYPRLKLFLLRLLLWLTVYNYSQPEMSTQQLIHIQGDLQIMTCPKRWLALGALLSGLSVAAGAFGAHGLDQYFRVKYENEDYEKKAVIDGREVVLSKRPLAEKFLADVKTGAEYQMYHGLALLAVGILAHWRPARGLNVAGWCFLFGCLSFSGGLYVYTLTNAKVIGMTIVPIGGVLFLAGWTSLAITILQSQATPEVEQGRDRRL